MLEAIRGLSPRPIRHIVLTSGGDQQAGGAANLAKAGRYIRVIDSIDPRGLDARASIIAHLNVLNRMTQAKCPRTPGRPTPTSRRVVALLERRGRAAVSRPRGAQRRRHDRVLPPLRRRQHRRDFRHDGYPRFDPERGGGIAGIIEGLNRVLDIAVPARTRKAARW